MRETKSLKAKIDLLETENKALKKSLYDLSYIYSSQIEARQNGDDMTSGSTTGGHEEDGSNGVGQSRQSSQVRSSSSNDMVSAVGQLLSSLSMAQQSQSAEATASSAGQGPDSSPRNGDPKKSVDLIKVEEEGVRRLNMGNIGKWECNCSKKGHFYVPFALDALTARGERLADLLHLFFI